jgi:hypothetical protein
MRRELLWTLAASAVLSAWALLSPGSKLSGSGVVAPVERAPDPLIARFTAASSSTSGQPTHAQGAQAALPATWPAPAMEAAPRSPFTQPIPLTPKPLAGSPVAPFPPPSPLPPPPQVTYRFWGSLTTPAGERVLYVSRDDNAQPIAIHVGTRLDGGFEVEQVTSGVIVLLQAESQQRVTLSMSPPSSVGAH